ncbi:MAG: hypothetical protein ACKVYV_11930 [Limisphaerales bacterium]
MKPRAGQVEFERGVQRHRVCGFLTRRQYGKTTTAARVALKKMIRTPNHTVVFGSVKLDLAREIVRKESEAMQRAAAMLDDDAAKAGVKLALYDAGKGREVGALKPDDFAELYEAQRLEFRLHHSRTIYSRTKVVALTPAAVGETGDLILDEVGRVKDFRAVWEAVTPIIASNPDFRCLLTTTPPPDDAHYSFELLAPPLDQDMPVCARGNWYRSDLGVQVLRVTAWDAEADGITLYDDDTGAPISAEASRARAHDKDAWDRNYGVRFVFGGTAAVGLLVLDAAQRRGIGRCTCITVQEDTDFDRALAWLREKLGAGAAGLGLDLATTEQQQSNPTALTVMERDGPGWAAVLTVVWKTTDPALARSRIRAVIETVNARPKGGRARRLCIDATNERYFATELQRELAALLPVELVIASETVEVPGREPINFKQLLGGELVADLDDNRGTVAPERYVKDDFRRVRRERGSFACETGPGGEHGDTFDSHKLARRALVATGGAIESVAGFFVPRSLLRRPTFRPPTLLAHAL